MPLLTLLLSVWLASSASSQPAPAYRQVLARHALDEARLHERGFALRDGSCFHLGADGSALPPGLTPEELDAALGLAASDHPSKATARSAATLSLKIDGAYRSLVAFNDGLQNLALSAVLAPAPAPPAPPAPKPPYIEPPFDSSWASIAAGLRDDKRRAKALKTLAARFQADEDSATGLSAAAPEALRALTAAIQDGGGAGMTGELRRELALVAGLEPSSKEAFANSLKSPLTVYVALSNSHAT
jgi:hypothetical protein